MQDIRALALFLCLGGGMLLVKMRLLGAISWIYSMTCVGLLAGIMMSSDEDLRVILHSNDKERRDDALRPILFCTGGGLFLGLLISLNYIIK